MSLFKYITLSFILFFVVNSQILAQDQIKYLDETINQKDYINIETNLLANILKEHNYRKLGINSFKQRCLDYFGININPFIEEYSLHIKGVSGWYDISVKQEYLSLFGDSVYVTFFTPNKKTIAQVKEQIDSKNNIFNQLFIAYNKLLFNDDSSPEIMSFFLKKDSVDYLREIVFYFDYEKNETLYKAAIPNIATTINKISTNQHLLFYNNQQKGYKKRLLNDLYIERGVVGIEKIIGATYKNWKKFNSKLYGVNDKKITINQSLQDKALLHLIKLISHHQDTTQSQVQSEQLAYSYLIKFMDKDPELEKRLKQINYYDMGLTVLPQEKRVISDKKNELIENHYITQSKDNYINFRKEPNTKSEVIKKLNNKIRVIKLKTEGDWYYVGLLEDDAMKGYIHMSQLQYVD